MGIEHKPDQNRLYPIIAGGSPELTTLATFTVNHVGGKIVGQRKESDGTMVGGRMEGGITVEVPYLSEEARSKTRKIITEECNVGETTVSIDMITDDVLLVEDLKADSLVAGSLGLRFQDEILHGNVFPAQFATLITKPIHIYQVNSISLLEESPIPGIPLEEAKLQLMNGLMFQWLEVAREKVNNFDDSSIAEITTAGRA